jgi:2-dehydro-3-deoxygluconokinase
LGLYFLETGSGTRASNVIIYDRAGSSVKPITPGTIDWREALKETTYLVFIGWDPQHYLKAQLVLCF